MRWQGLSVEEESERRLPRLSADSVMRTFEAPEALGIRFHEIRARSALNKVPKSSRMPFRYTVNPYRGCSHACAYCLSGETPILMAHGGTKPLADVRVGDEIYGTVREGRYRRYTTVRVLAHWQTRKPPYRITLEDGTELVASGDHRFLTDRGWKYVTGSEQGSSRRPHLTLNSKLLGSGAFASPPEHSADYRLGYLCGVIRGDGHIGSYNSATREFAFAAAEAGGGPMTAVRSVARDTMSAEREAILWPRNPTTEWVKGFLAGIFDAEGSFGHVVRIANCDPELIDWTTYGLRRLGFAHTVEKRNQPNGLTYVRLLGGLRQNLRFFHTVDPAITRKRSIEGTAIKCAAPLGVVSIESLNGSMDLFDITTSSGDFIANGIVSHNCFARPTHTYLDLNAREDFEREIIVKVNVPELLNVELARPSWKHEHVALGTNTDPYQWVEGRYKLMPGIWKALRDSGTPGSLVTKSPLVLRDVELLKQLHERSEMTVYMSVPTLDEGAWRETEPHTPSPRARIEAVAKLNQAGVPAGILVAPLMPGVNDSPEQVKEILRLAGEAGAVSVAGVTLHVRGEVRDIFFDWLRCYRPDLIPHYEEIYKRGAYAGTQTRREHTALIDYRRRTGRRRGLRKRETEQERPSASAEPEQSSLF